MQAFASIYDITWKTFILIAVYYYFQVMFYLLRNLGQIVSPGQIKIDCKWEFTEIL